MKKTASSRELPVKTALTSPSFCCPRATRSMAWFGTRAPKAMVASIICDRKSHCIKPIYSTDARLHR